MIPQVQRRALRLAAQPRFEQLVATLEPLTWLSLREASGSIAQNRAYTTTSPQQPGPELLTNGDFSAWTGTPPNDQPDDWGTSETPTGGYVTENPGGACQFISDGAFVSMSQAVLTGGDSYRSECEITTVASGDLVWGSPFNDGAMGGTTGHKLRDFVAPNGSPNFRFRRSSACDVTIDDISVRKIGEVDAALAEGVTLSQVGLLGGTHACAIDGSTGVATIYNRASIQGMAAFTLSQLIKPDTLADGDYLWFKADEIEVWLNTDGSIFARAHYSMTDAETTSAAGAISSGGWYLVDVVLDSSDKTLYLYVNGALVNSSIQAGAGSRVSNTNDLLLWKNASSNGFDGLVDEIFLKPSAASEADLVAIAHSLTGLG